MCTGVTMMGLLSLPDEVIELVGMHFLEPGLRQWCQVTTTCKRLWDMQLPESSFDWVVDLADGMESKSKLSLPIVRTT